MTRIGLANGAAFALALLLAVLAGGGSELFTGVAADTTVDGPESVADATGHVVEVRRYERIASCSTISDRVLLELVERSRIAAVTEYGATSFSWSHRAAGLPQVRRLTDIEGMLAVAPDLVLLNNFADDRAVSQARRAGLRVFDLGPIRGLESLLEDIRSLGAVVGETERADAYATALERRMNAVASDVPAAARRSGLYVSLVGGHLYGGGAGSSYDDILTYGGVVNIAAGDYEGAPEYTNEQLLTMDPELLITRGGMGVPLCRHPGLDRLSACRSGDIVELPGALVDDPGPDMLSAAEALRAALYAD